MVNKTEDEKLIDILNSVIDVDGERLSVRVFLYKLLERLLVEREEFSAKRPLGDSDWDMPIDILISKQFPKVLKIKMNKKLGYLDGYEMKDYHKFMELNKRLIALLLEGK